MDLGVVGRDRGGDVLENRGLARLGWRDDKAALPLADGGDEIDRATRDRVLPMLHDEPLVRIDRSHVDEPRSILHLLGKMPVDGVDAVERRVFLVVTCGTALTGEIVTATQGVAPDRALPHIDVVLAGEIPSATEESISLGKDIEDTRDLDEALGLDHRIVEDIDDLGLLLRGLETHIELGGLGPKLHDLERLQVLPGHLRLDRLAPVAPTGPAMAPMVVDGIPVGPVIALPLLVLLAGTPLGRSTLLVTGCLLAVRLLRSTLARRSLALRGRAGWPVSATLRHVGGDGGPFRRYGAICRRRAIRAHGISRRRGPIRRRGLDCGCGSLRGFHHGSGAILLL